MLVHVSKIDFQTACRTNQNQIVIRIGGITRTASNDLIWLLVDLFKVTVAMLPLLNTLSRLNLLPEDARTWFRTPTAESFLIDLEKELLAAHAAWRLSQDAKEPALSRRMFRWADTAFKLAKHTVHGQIRLLYFDFIIFIVVIASSEMDGHTESQVRAGGLGWRRWQIARAATQSAPVRTAAPQSPLRPAAPRSQLNQTNWIGDDEAVACMICDKKFTMINRRHHCRGCGLLVCASCAPKRQIAEGEGTLRERRCSACA